MIFGTSMRVILCENTVSQFLIEKDNKEVSENKEMIKAKTVHDLSELMRLKTEQLKKYGAVLISIFETSNGTELFMDAVKARNGQPRGNLTESSYNGCAKIQ